MSIELDGEIITKNHNYKFCDLDFRCVYVSVTGKGFDRKTEATFRLDVSDKCYIHLKYLSTIHFPNRYDCTIYYRLDSLKFATIAHDFNKNFLDAMHGMIQNFKLLKNRDRFNKVFDDNCIKSTDLVIDKIESLYAIRDILE